MAIPAIKQKSSSLIKKIKQRFKQKNKTPYRRQKQVKKSCQKMKNKDLTNSNDSKLTESKLQRNLHPTKMIKAAKSLQKR